ncbi:hypothetical protein ANCCEY_15041 [Ancylostoma ceylanicum]|uniref:FAD-binding domain-containing protein n=1 Tax=Ancylostoma ceylanicum TaxID=53326 RepID=A0A0D6L8E1_9BILA|nr:hypothetical protein ANCCEY_15041 [Ancylostoma ceylanicum]
MKKQSIKGLAFIAVAGSLATSCDLLKDLDYTVTPDPLEMHGDSVRVKVDVTFPEKGIKKKVTAEVTPYLASTPLKPLSVQGEKATGNGTVIQYKAGGKVTYTDVVPYKADMETSALTVTGKVFKGAKEKEQLDTISIADATIITPYLVNKDFRVIYEADQFKRVTEEKQFAQINYEKGKSNVRPAELKDKDIVDLQAWLQATQSNPKINIKSINIVGYASPEGEEDKNNSLSTDRSNTGKETVLGVAKKAKNDKAQTEIYSLKGSGEDYEGFKRELTASKFNEDEKNLILRVLEMYKESSKREEEMRAMGKTFTQLDKDIFPLLRRSEIHVIYDLTGYSDEELKSISVATPDSLNLEELLFTATLTNDLNEKLRLYQWNKKNACLVGDAAHATTPNLGQGACQAIEDAYVLGALFRSKQNLADAFSAYPPLRLTKAHHIVNTSWTVGKLAHLDNRFKIGVRNVIMKATPASVMQKQMNKIFTLEC